VRYLGVVAVVWRLARRRRKLRDYFALFAVPTVSIDTIRRATDGRTPPEKFTALGSRFDRRLEYRYVSSQTSFQPSNSRRRLLEISVGTTFPFLPYPIAYFLFFSLLLLAFLLLSFLLPTSSQVPTPKSSYNLAAVLGDRCKLPQSSKNTKVSVRK